MESHPNDFLQSQQICTIIVGHSKIIANSIVESVVVNEPHRVDANEILSHYGGEVGGRCYAIT